MHPTNKISTTINFNQKKKKFYKKFFLIKKIILICEEIYISKKKKKKEIKIKIQYYKNQVININYKFLFFVIP